MLMQVGYLVSLYLKLIPIAFGGFAGLAPGLRHLTKGLDRAHSLTLDGTPTSVTFLDTLADE
jgi:hypothetical protein